MSDSETRNDIENKNNYNDTIDITLRTMYINKYIDIIHQYLLYCGENIFIQKKEYYIYVIIKGVECISNIYNLLLLYTKNFDLVYYHCQKAFCYYVEFISQIGNENNSYLKLNPKDAILFVYRKTIFQINNDYRKEYMTKDTEKKFFHDICNICQEINKLISVQVSNIYNIDNNDDNHDKMKDIIVNDSNLFKHIYDKDNIYEILKINNKIIEDLTHNFEVNFILQVLNHYNKKISNIDDYHKENYVLKSYIFTYNDSYANLSPLRLSNILINV